MPDQTYENADNSSQLANDLFTAQAGGLTIPTAPDFSDDDYNISPGDSPLYDEVATVAIADVTEDCLDGNGSFDKFMPAMDKHLQREYEQDRITGTQYAESLCSDGSTGHGTGRFFCFAEGSGSLASNHCTDAGSYC